MNILKRFLLKCLAPEISKIVQEENKTREDENRKKQADSRRIEFEVLYPIGSKVIARSNEDEPFMVAEVLGYEKIGHDSWFIRASEVGSGRIFYLGNQILKPYRESLIVALNKLTNKEQWNLMAQSYWIE